MLVCVQIYALPNDMIERRLVLEIVNVNFGNNLHIIFLQTRMHYSLSHILPVACVLFSISNRSHT